MSRDAAIECMRVAGNVEARERAHHAKPVVGVERAKVFVIEGRNLVFSRKKKREEDVAEMRFLLVRECRVCGRLAGERWRQSSGVVERLFERRFDEIPCVRFGLTRFGRFCNNRKHCNTSSTQSNHMKND